MSNLWEQQHHLSASQINAMKNSPAAFVVQRLFKVWDKPSPAMIRGKSAEAAVEWGLLNENKSSQDVADMAASEFDAEAPSRRSSKDADQWEKEKGVAQQCAVNAYEFIKAQNWGPLTETQTKVSYEFPDIEIPIIGYTDFTFGESGLVCDLKATGRAQNKPKADHALQIAGYAKAQSNYQQALLYCFPKPKSSADQFGARFFKLSPETMEAQLRLACHVAHQIKALLSLSDDPNEIARYVSPDLDSFYFSGAVREKAIEIFGRDYQ